MASADTKRRRGWAWALALAVPVAVPAGAADPPSADQAPPEAGLLEFLAEEPAQAEELSDALLSSDLDRAIERSAKNRKVKSDGKDTQ